MYILYVPCTSLMHYAHELPYLCTEQINIQIPIQNFTIKILYTQFIATCDFIAFQTSYNRQSLLFEQFSTYELKSDS